MFDNENSNARPDLSIDDRVGEVSGRQAPSPASSGRAEAWIGKEKLGYALELSEEPRGKR